MDGNGKFDANVNYQALIDQAVAARDFKTAGTLEASRNAKIDAMGLDYGKTQAFGSAADLERLTNEELGAIYDARQAAAASGDYTWAHGLAEQMRARHGYTGGADGSSVSAVGPDTDYMSRIEEAVAAGDYKTAAYEQMRNAKIGGTGLQHGRTHMFGSPEEVADMTNEELAAAYEASSSVTVITDVDVDPYVSGPVTTDAMDAGSYEPFSEADLAGLQDTPDDVACYGDAFEETGQAPSWTGFAEPVDAPPPGEGCPGCGGTAATGDRRKKRRRIRRHGRACLPSRGRLRQPCPHGHAGPSFPSPSFHGAVTGPRRGRKEDGLSAGGRLHPWPTAGDQQVATVPVKKAFEDVMSWEYPGQYCTIAMIRPYGAGEKAHKGNP